jgi:phosphatidylglycerol---prolipoprotein diacylglyceryl transferase
MTDYMVMPNIDPVVHLGNLALQIGPLAIRWYALAYILGIGLGWYVAGRLIRNTNLWPAKQPPLNATQLDDLILWLGLGTIVGGRLGYVFIYNLPATLANPWSIFAAWNGGMSFHGGFLGVVLAAALFCRNHRFTPQQILSVGDILATVAPIGLLFGRLANFVNGELWGRVTEVPWAIIFCNQHILTAYGYCPAGDLPRHPSQLYEAALEGVGLLVLAYVLGHRLGLYKRPGFIWGVFMLGYGLSRTLVETVRNPDAQMPDYPFGLTMGMILSLPMIAAGVYLIWRALKTPAAETPEAATK